MLTDLKFWVDLAGVAIEVILLAYFMHVMLGPMRCPWYVGIAVYMILGGCLVAVSYSVEQAYGRTICYFFVIAIVTVPFYKGKIWSKTFTGVCFVLISGLLEYIVHGFLMSIAGEVYATGKNNLQDYVLGLSVSKCLLLILIQVLSEWAKRTNQQEGQLSRQNFFLLLGFPIVTIGAFFVLYYAFISRNDSQGIFLLLVITILFLMADIGIFVLFNRLTEAARLEQEHTVAKQQIANQQQYYEALAVKNQSLRQWNHEIKNAFVVIAAYIQRGQLQEALDYISKTEGYLRGTMETMTGHIALDAVLDNKKQIAKSIGVELQCTVAITQAIHIEITDLVVVLANGLDNALEAVAELPKPEGKVITCDMTLQRNWFKIVIVNPVSERVNIENGSLPTHKADTLRHGIGLTNVKTMVERHQGQLELKCDNKFFTFAVVLANK